MSAWYRQTLPQFVSYDPESIVNRLATHSAEHSLDANPESVASWRRTVQIMQLAARFWLKNVQGATDWAILFEYELPRRAKRVDVVLLARDVIGLFEFKVGSSRFGRDGIWQAKQYGLDLRDFHQQSRDRTIVPFLVATDIQSSEPMPQNVQAGVVNEVNCVSAQDMASRFAVTFRHLPDGLTHPIDLVGWDTSPYQPTPWIIEAAQCTGDQTRRFAESRFND